MVVMLVHRYLSAGISLPGLALRSLHLYEAAPTRIVAADFGHES